MDEKKPILQSKTLWFNLFVALFAVLADHTDLLRNSLSDSSYLVLMMAISAGNIYLRTITTTAVTLTLTKPVVSLSDELTTGLSDELKTDGDER